MVTRDAAALPTVDSLIERGGLSCHLGTEVSTGGLLRWPCLTSPLTG